MSIKRAVAKLIPFLILGFHSLTAIGEDAIDLQVQADTLAANSQARINRYDDEAKAALQAYRVALKRAESLEIFNKQLGRLVDSQKEEIESIKRQIDEIESIETGALPLMLEMTDTLEQMILADTPFLLAERQDRAANLASIIDRADVTAGEKFRRIMEAYIIEADYGRTVEAYRGDIKLEEQIKSVDFLRIGRTGLYFQTLDGNETGRWNEQKKGWEILDDSYTRTVRDGLRIARKQAPPDLLKLPISKQESQI